MAISLKEATSTLKKLNTKVRKGDVAGGNDILAEMKVSYKQKKGSIFLLKINNVYPLSQSILLYLFYIYLLYNIRSSCWIFHQLLNTIPLHLKHLN